MTFWTWKGGAIQLGIKTVLSQPQLLFLSMQTLPHAAVFSPRLFHNIGQSSAQKHPCCTKYLASFIKLYKLEVFKMCVMVIMSSLRIMLRCFSRAALRTHKHLWKSHIISLLLETLIIKEFLKICWKRKMCLNLIKIILGWVGQILLFLVLIGTRQIFCIPKLI